MPPRLNPLTPAMSHVRPATDIQNNTLDSTPMLARQAPARGPNGVPGRVRALASCFGSETEVDSQNRATLAAVDRWRAVHRGENAEYACKKIKAALRKTFADDGQSPSMPLPLLDLYTRKKSAFSRSAGSIRLIGLNSIPPEIGQVKALEINLRSNRLTSFPGEIGQARMLKTLNLTLNKLTSFPAEMGQATALETLTLAFNELDNLPTEIARLPNLRHLDLSSNNFSHVPRGLLEARAEAEIDLRQNPLPADEIRAVRAEMAQRRAAGRAVPQLILPPLEVYAGEPGALAGELQDAVDNNMNVHTGVLTQAFANRLDILTKQFPNHLVGSVREQQAQLTAIEHRLTQALDAHAQQQAPEATTFPQARNTAQLMFQKGLGQRGSYFNDFERSAGHVLAYTFLALEAQWARTPLVHRAEARRNGMTALVQALDNGSGMCDTRLCEEVMQTIGLPLTEYAQAHAKVVGIQPVQISAQESQDIVVEQAQQVLARLINTDPSLYGDTLRYNWRYTLLEKIQTDHPKMPPEHADKEIQKIESAWEEFHDMVLESRLGILIQ